MSGTANGTSAAGGGTGTGFERARAVADAVLYEGYLLYPYRRSAVKNRMRWQFGVVAPRRWAEASGPVEPVVAGSVESWQQQTECLFEAGRPARDVVIRVRLRFLRVRAKDVERRLDGRYLPVDSVDVDGVGHLSVDEALPQEFDVAARLSDLLAADLVRDIHLPGGDRIEQLGRGIRIVRRSAPVSASLVLHVHRVDAALHRVRVRVENTGDVDGAASRAEALRHSLVATHVLIGGTGLAFLSMMDPPEPAVGHAERSRNIHTFPVLVGASRDLVLSSPILLPDHPEVAPESPGDLHEAAEIDELLSLRTLTLTDEEKREARATDPRAAEILDRVDTMPPEVLSRLHGTLRSLRRPPA
ncbi:hypothetical protein GCM10011581_25130 [Saccharopolyspora subtropica]|uniref:Uncharacterized protein n=1 Tax=Saccharopolyspora thermophila TaxID=89367 RepID=A0A917JVS7_9PSEU|nr:hypothetical protein [Saccharopolyspora subtropica]GGI87027.1 hypothetical protein GCM10011581_25130 [Saccharopolyspora subtropica]